MSKNFKQQVNIIFLTVILVVLFSPLNQVSSMFTSNTTNQDISQASISQPTASIADSQSSNTDYSLITYPTPNTALSSSNYTLTVNGKPVFVEQYNSTNYAHFAFIGKADIEISAREDINNYTLSPKSYNIPLNKDGNKVYFSLEVPTKLILHKVNSFDKTLVIIADSPEDNQPKLDMSNVVNIMKYNVDNTGVNDETEKIQTAIFDVSQKQGILYFPPGIYKTKQLNLASNMTLYLAGGSVLEASTESNPSYGKGLLYLENVSDTKIRGRGVINGNGSYWRSRGGWYSTIAMSNTNNVDVEDIIIRDTCVANVWIEYSQNIHIYNTKLLADPSPFHVNTDGFDFWSSINITVDNIFYKGTDDATSHGGDKKTSIQNNDNISVRNSVFYINGTGVAFTIGSETKQNLVNNINYENIDIVNAPGLASLRPLTGANFENIYFKNIRIENLINGSLFQWYITPVEWEPASSPDTLGYIKNVYFQNLIVDDVGDENSQFRGYDAKRSISNVNFDNFYLNGKLVTKLEEASFSVMPSTKDGNNYANLTFLQNKLTILNVTATKKDASVSGVPGEFLITRTGDTSQELQVNYSIRGTAENGKDYQQIASHIIIPEGNSSAKIPIKAIADDDKGIKTVLLSLENQSNDAQYMVGTKYHAVVSIRD